MQGVVRVSIQAVAEREVVATGRDASANAGKEDKEAIVETESKLTPSVNLKEQISIVQTEAYCRTVPKTGFKESCLGVLKLFRNDEDIPCVVMCDDMDRPLGILMRDTFYRQLAGRFAADLFYDRPALMFAEKFPLIRDITTSPRGLIDAALNREAKVFYDSLIITEQGKFKGILTVHDLMLMSRELQREADHFREVIVSESKAKVLEIDQSVKEVSVTSERGLRDSEQMSSFAATGRAELEAVQASFGRVLTLTKSQEERVSALLQHASNISSIASSIRELADRSGLLAMNATIEAAHAGEHGKGFAVVASEIRNLAQQTKQFSGEIGETLNVVGELVQQTADASSITTLEMQSSHDRVSSADHTFKMLVDSVRNTEMRGREMFETAENAAHKTEIVLRELVQLSAKQDMNE